METPFTITKNQLINLIDIIGDITAHIEINSCDSEPYKDWVVGISGQKNDSDGNCERKAYHDSNHSDMTSYKQWGCEEFVARLAETILLESPFKMDGGAGGGNKEKDTPPPDKIYVFKKNEKG